MAASALVTLASNENERCLSDLAANTTRLYVSACKTIMQIVGLRQKLSVGSLSARAITGSLRRRNCIDQECRRLASLRHADCL